MVQTAGLVTTCRIQRAVVLTTLSCVDYESCHISCTFQIQRAVLAALCDTDGGPCHFLVYNSTCGTSGSVWYRRRVVSPFVYISTCGTSGSVWYRARVVSLFVFISTCGTSGCVWCRLWVLSLSMFSTSVFV